MRIHFITACKNGRNIFMFQTDRIEEEYQELINEKKAIREDVAVQSHLIWAKASNDLSLAKLLFKISTQKELKELL